MFPLLHKILFKKKNFLGNKFKNCIYSYLRQLLLYTGDHHKRKINPTTQDRAVQSRAQRHFAASLQCKTCCILSTFCLVSCSVGTVQP